MSETKQRKLKHYFEKGAVYFITSVTKDRKEIFNHIITARFLAITIAYHKFILNFSLFGYVIMPDHFHLLLQLDDKYPLSIIMKGIKGNFARKYNEFLDQKFTQNTLLGDHGSIGNKGNVGNVGNIGNIGSRYLSIGYEGEGEGDNGGQGGEKIEGVKRHPLGHLYLPVWQREYYEHIIRDEKDFIEKLNYIHNNPVKKGIVNSPADYEFSSYHQWYGETRQNIQIPIDKIMI